MGKLLILFAVVFAVILVVRVLGKSAPRGPARRDGPPVRVVPCAHCGLHVPEGQAIRAEGRHFCSDEHRRLYRS